MSEKIFTGKFRNKLKQREGTSTPEDLVTSFNKDKEIESDFEEHKEVVENTLVGKPTGGGRKRKSAVQPVETIVEEETEIEDSLYEDEYREEDFTEDEVESKGDFDDYIGHYDFEEIARTQKEEEDRNRKLEDKRLEDVRRKNKAKRRSPYSVDTIEVKETKDAIYGGPKIDLNVDEEHYPTSERVRTLKPVLSADKTEIEVGTLDIKPLKIGSISDEKGYISSRINAIEDKYNIAVLPFSITGTLPQVDHLADHKILYINNMKYSSGTKRIVNQSKMDRYIENIRRHIEQGESFDDTLLERANIEGKVFDTLKFNEMELQMINTLFLEVTAVFYMDASGDMRINVGGYNV